MNPLHCISFLTTFGGRDLTCKPLASDFSEWIYGGDFCQDVCPMNHKKWMGLKDFPDLPDLASHLTAENILKMEPNNEPNLNLSECACRNLRMTTRVITQYYDKALQASGLKSPQFALLNDIISRENGISVNELADLAMMDQTTVTRNVEILRKKGYVDVKTEDTDSRKKCITISQAGRNKLLLAMPHWQDAQIKLEQIVGREQYNILIKTLSELRDIK